MKNELYNSTIKPNLFVSTLDLNLWLIHQPFLDFSYVAQARYKKNFEIVSWQGPSLVWNHGIEETKIMTWQEFQPIGIWKLGGVGWWLTSSGTELYSHRLLNRTEMNRQAIANSAKHRSLLSLVNIKWNLLRGMNRKEIVFLGLNVWRLLSSKSCDIRYECIHSPYIE